MSLQGIKIIQRDGKEFTEDGREIHTLFDGHKVIGPSLWYLKQLEEMRKLPPPTIEQVKTQFEAARRLRKEYDLKELKELCSKVLNDGLSLDDFLDNCQMIFLSNGWNVEKREMGD